MATFHFLHAGKIGVPDALKIIIALSIASLAVPAHSQTAQPAGACELGSDALLACVSGLARGLQQDSLLGSVVLTRLRDPLNALTRRDGYDGADGDLDELKRLSNALKTADKDGNYDAISALDNAIASHKSEMRPALSPRAIAAKSNVGDDIHSTFVQQKLDYLKSDKAKFYDNGPFALVRRGLLAGALEDTYFVERDAGKDDKELLREELGVLDDLIRRLHRGDYARLLEKQNAIAQAELNNFMFWRATILFLLADPSNMRKTLGEIVSNNQNFGLETNNGSTQLYTYRLFNEPYQIVVIPGKLSPDFAVKDRNVLRRFYNAAQLSALVCGFDREPTNGAIKALKKIVIDFDPHDYSVIAGTASNSAEIQKIDATINQYLQQEKLKEARTKLINDLAEESKPIANFMKLGADKCGIRDEDGNRIYSPFVFKSQIKQIGSSWYVLFGGWLSESQATTIAEFIRQSAGTDSSTQGAGAKGFRPYAAREITN